MCTVKAQKAVGSIIVYYFFPMIVLLPQFHLHVVPLAPAYFQAYIYIYHLVLWHTGYPENIRTSWAHEW